MKKGVLVLAMLALIAGPARAQVSFGAGAHAGIAISSFEKAVKDYYGLGYGFGVHGDLNVGKFFTGRLNFDYHLFGLDKKKLVDVIAAENNVPTSDLTLEGLTANLMAITLNGMGKIPAGGIVSPYALAGFGMYFISQSDPKLTYQGQDVTSQVFPKPESRTKFGINFGAGAGFDLSKAFNLGADFRYVVIFSKDDTKGYENNSYMPVTVYATFFFN